MPLIAMGVNHRTAPLELRERLAIAEGRVRETISGIMNVPGLSGGAILSTCNRVELVVSAENEEVIGPLAEWLAARAGLTRTDLERHLYVLRHIDVVRHLFRVAAGLDSMIVGEPQIGGQVRSAFVESQESGLLDPLLNQLFEQTMRVARRVRSETGIGENAVSVPYAAVELAKKIFGDLRGLYVLLVGAGEMGELTAAHLASQNVRQVIVANKTYEKALELAARFHGEAVQYDRFAEHLAICDIAIVSTAAPHHLVSAEQVARSLEMRRSRNLFLIDLSVPRNIDPAVGTVEGAYLYNIDDLQQVADANIEMRRRRSVEAEAIVAREAENFRRRLVSQDAVPTIVELQQRVEAIRAAELEKCLRRIGPVTAEQREAIEMLTTQMVNKILHYPILQLKESSDEPERESLKQTIRKIFGLR